MFLTLRNSRSVIKYFGLRYVPDIQRWSSNLTVQIFSPIFGRDSIPLVFSFFYKGFWTPFLSFFITVHNFRALKPLNSLLIRNLSSSLEFPGRLHKSRWSWPDRHLLGPRNSTLSDQCLSTFFCTTTYYGTFPNAFSSSDALLLVNRALSPTQKLKSWPPTIAPQNFNFSLSPEEKKYNFDLCIHNYI